MGVLNPITPLLIGHRSEDAISSENSQHKDGLGEVRKLLLLANQVPFGGDCFSEHRSVELSTNAPGIAFIQQSGRFFIRGNATELHGWGQENYAHLELF